MRPDTVPHLPQFGDPRSILDLVNYCFARFESYSGSLVTRMCEGEFGITRREWRFIALLASHGALAPSQLATQASLDRARTSKALALLMEKGLVERAAVRGDGRRSEVRLSPQGQAVYDRIFPRVVEINLAMLAPLSEVERGELARMVALLQQRAEEVAASGVFDTHADRRHGGSRRQWQARGADKLGGSGR